MTFMEVLIKENKVPIVKTVESRVKSKSVMLSLNLSNLLCTNRTFFTYAKIKLRRIEDKFLFSCYGNTQT